MIKATELRIGNRFVRELHTSRGLEYDHDFILDESNMGKLFGSNTSLILQDLWPIPLTPEVLEKCGFELCNPPDGVVYELKLGNLSNPTSLQTMLIEDNYVQICRSGISAINVPCKHLHQLQNLYYALTGHELEVNL